MGYLHLPQLYKQQDILLFKECFALEKIHGTSAHISYNHKELKFFSGGESHERFVGLFDSEVLINKLKLSDLPSDKSVTVFGEAYGGKQQGMSDTYGKELKFIAFDVKIGDCWLDVPKAERFVLDLGLEFVYYVRISTDLKEIDAQKDADSVQAIRNGVGPGKLREGVVLRPLIELTKNNGERVICKHKRDEFKETKTPRQVIDPARLEILAQTDLIVEEWVTKTRLVEHILNKIPDHCMEKVPLIIKAMVEDVMRESAGEIIETQDLKKVIGKKTVVLYKDYLKGLLNQNT